jgi:N utilization substance protein B
MLSRRNIRIKVMQMLYSMSRDPELQTKDAIKRYQLAIQKSYELYLFTLQSLIRIAEYSKHDAAKKMAKLLPSEEDKQFTAKLSQNDLLQSLSENEGLQKLLKDYKLRHKIDQDSIRVFYADFAKTDYYKDYLKDSADDEDSHRQILLALLKHCISYETFSDYLEEYYPNWIDDDSLVVGALKKTIKALPADETFYENYEPGKEAVTEFGQALLRKVCEDDEELLAIIEPTLKNWDADRVAVIDMILLKMAVAELTEFTTIPTKVTLNEYVEISKMYSTDKSKDFINGILDRLMKLLNKEGKIKKTGRGLKD